VNTLHKGDDDDDDDDDDNNNNNNKNIVTYVRKNRLGLCTLCSYNELPQCYIAYLPLHHLHNSLSSAKEIKQQRRH
jgi:hypothetical protein